MRATVVALTGAHGYVGSIIGQAIRGDAEVVGLVRSPHSMEEIAWSFGDEPGDLASALASRGAAHLIHAAWDMKANSRAELERTCVNGSRRLIEAAKGAAVKRLIFISSISAFEGARSSYGRSKLEVERMFLDAGGTVLRLGLVYGYGNGGLFGSLRSAVRGGRFVPLIGRGTAPLYLLHEATLGEVARKAIRGAFNGATGPITIANPDGIPFRDLVRSIAEAEGRTVTLVPLPWPLLYAGVRTAEAMGLKLGVRSDSIISFVFQDPAPAFDRMRGLGVIPPPLNLR
jgi:nucleoside-diphosphate-sugar epimerase